MKIIMSFEATINEDRVTSFISKKELENEIKEILKNKPEDECVFCHHQETNETNEFICELLRHAVGNLGKLAIQNIARNKALKLNDKNIDWIKKSAEIISKSYFVVSNEIRLLDDNK